MASPGDVAAENHSTIDFEVIKIMQKYDKTKPSKRNRFQQLNCMNDLF